MTTWRVGAIVNESVSDTLRFAAWYLEMGANGLTILFDNPNDPSLNFLENHEQIQCVRCDDAFWQSLGVSPDRMFVKRQNAALNWVYRNTEEGWLLNVDCDEFLYVSDGKWADHLGRLNPSTDSIRIETAETLCLDLTPNNFMFRLPMPKWFRRQLYAEDAGLFSPQRNGFLGHSIGKSTTRTGLERVKMRQHWPIRLGQPDLDIQVRGAGSGIYLLHFIGNDFDIWSHKLSWRLNSRGFAAKLKSRVENAMNAKDADVQIRDLFDRLHSLNPSQVEVLRQSRFCLELSLDFEDLVDKHFGEAAVAAYKQNGLSE